MFWMMALAALAAAEAGEAALEDTAETETDAAEFFDGSGNWRLGSLLRGT
jgi:hypothetical protein